jgi:LDH2 family malate/lactate/ureidoglycolate dehydrogenase
MTTVRIEAPRLGTYCAGILRGLGVPDDQATIVADSLVEADLRGAASHGVNLVALYVSRIRAGSMRARTEIRVLIVPPFGGITLLISTNPFSNAIPAGEEAPVVLDMATTAVAGNKLILARKRGEAIHVARGVFSELEGFGRDYGLGLLAETGRADAREAR